jgi:hypothetical protein
VEERQTPNQENVRPAAMMGMNSAAKIIACHPRWQPVSRRFSG